MIRINLLPLKEVQRARDRRRQLSIAVLALAGTVLVMALLHLIQGVEIRRLERETEALRAEVARLDQQAKEVRDLERKRTDLRAKLKVIADLQSKRTGPLRMMEDLADATPEKLWLEDFVDTGGQATITGKALDNQTIAAFMRDLQASTYFYDVDLVEATEDAPARGPAEPRTGGTFMKFVVKARLDYAGTDGKAATPAPGDGPRTRGAASGGGEADA